MRWCAPRHEALRTPIMFAWLPDQPLHGTSEWLEQYEVHGTFPLTADRERWWHLLEQRARS